MLYKQKKDYDCGLASIKTLISNLNIKVPKDNELSNDINLSKEYGTRPASIINFLNRNNIIIRRNRFSPTDKIGIVLFNVNLLYNEFPKDKQNGHWCYFELKQDTDIYLVYDVYTNKKNIFTKEQILKYTKDIKVDDKIYNNIIMYFNDPSKNRLLG